MERPPGIDRARSVARGQRGSVDRDGERALRVFVVGEVRVYCDGLAHLLSAQPTVQVVGITAPTRESMQQIASAGPDVVLLESMTARRGDTVRLISAGRVPGRGENENGAFFRLDNHQPVALPGDDRRNTPWTRVPRS